MKGEMYKNEISLKLSLPSNLVGHHLDKLLEIGLLEVTERKLKRKHLQVHKFYRISSDIFITIDKTQEEVKKSGLLKRIFKDGIKFSSIGLAFMVSILINLEETIQTTNYPRPLGDIALNDNDFWTIPLFVLVICLITERIFFGIKKRKRS